MGIGDFAPVIGGDAPDDDIIYAQVSTDANGNTVLVGPDGPISVGGGDPTVYASVGLGGMYSNLADAITAMNALAPVALASTVATSLGATATLGGRNITVTPALPASLYLKTVLCRLGTGAYFEARVSTNGTSVKAKYPVKVAFTSIAMTVYANTLKQIEIMPGTNLSVTTAMPEIGTNTIITGNPDNHQITLEEDNMVLLAFAADGTRNGISGLNLTGKFGATSSQLVKFLGSTAYGELTEHVVLNSRMWMAAYDGIYLSAAQNGKVLIKGNQITGNYDLMRLSNGDIDVVGNVLTAMAYNYENEETACCVAYDEAVGATYGSTINIVGNTMSSYCKDEASIGSTPNAFCVEVRVISNSDTVINIKDNVMKAYSPTDTYVAGTPGSVFPSGMVAAVYFGGIIIQTTTPQINVVDNLIDCNRGAGSTGKFPIACNMQPNFVARSGGNTGINGGSVTNLGTVVAITQF